MLPISPFKKLNNFGRNKPLMTELKAQTKHKRLTQITFQYSLVGAGTLLTILHYLLILLFTFVEIHARYVYNIFEFYDNKNRH